MIPLAQRPTVCIGHRHGPWRVIDRLPHGSPVWGRTWLGSVWPWSRVLIGNGWSQVPEVLVASPAKPEDAA